MSTVTGTFGPAKFVLVTIVHFGNNPINNPIFWGYNIVLDQQFFEPTFCLTQTFCSQKYFVPKNFWNPNYFAPNIFEPKIFLNPNFFGLNFFWTEHFLYQYFSTNFFLTNNTFAKKNCTKTPSDTKFLLNPSFFGQ